MNHKIDPTALKATAERLSCLTERMTQLTEKMKTAAPMAPKVDATILGHPLLEQPRTTISPVTKEVTVTPDIASIIRQLKKVEKQFGNLHIFLTKRGSKKANIIYCIYVQSTDKGTVCILQSLGDDDPLHYN